MDAFSANEYNELYFLVVQTKPIAHSITTNNWETKREGEREKIEALQWNEENYRFD